MHIYIRKRKKKKARECEGEVVLILIRVHLRMKHNSIKFPVTKLYNSDNLNTQLRILTKLDSDAIRFKYLQDIDTLSKSRTVKYLKHNVNASYNWVTLASVKALQYFQLSACVSSLAIFV